MCLKKTTLIRHVFRHQNLLKIDFIDFQNIKFHILNFVFFQLLGQFSQTRKSLQLTLLHGQVTNRAAHHSSFFSERTVAISTRRSQTVTRPRTDLAPCCTTSVTLLQPVYSALHDMLCNSVMLSLKLDNLSFL